jgi:DNA-binding IclR family transcriptional regulator
MLSIFQTTNQGQITRSRILDSLKKQDGQTRKELSGSTGLSYEQVRNQTQNLMSEGAINSRTERGKRRYYLRIFVLLLVGWLPICGYTIAEEAVNRLPKELTHS